MYKKLGLMLLYAGFGYLIYVYGMDMLVWVEASNSIPLVILIAITVAMFPVFPYPLVGGMIGAAFGPILGGVITWIGSTAASIMMFLFVRYGYQEWGNRFLYRQNRLGQVTALFENNAFLTILFSRFIPFIPSFVINVYSAVSRVSFLSYILASALGKIPAMLLYAVVGDHLMTEPRNIVLTMGVYGIFISLTLLVYRYWKRKQLLQQAAIDTA